LTPAQNPRETGILIASATFDRALRRFIAHVASLSLLSPDKRAKVRLLGHNKGRNNAKKRAKRRKKIERLTLVKKKQQATK
jgi:hypothetical protein